MEGRIITYSQAKTAPYAGCCIGEFRCDAKFNPFVSFCLLDFLQNTQKHLAVSPSVWRYSQWFYSPFLRYASDSVGLSFRKRAGETLADTRQATRDEIQCIYIYVFTIAITTTISFLIIQFDLHVLIVLVRGIFEFASLYKKLSIRAPVPLSGLHARFDLLCSALPCFARSAALHYSRPLPKACCISYPSHFLLFCAACCDRRLRFPAAAREGGVTSRRTSNRKSETRRDCGHKRRKEDLRNNT